MIEEARKWETAYGMAGTTAEAGAGGDSQVLLF
jgi:hypothetical protein